VIADNLVINDAKFYPIARLTKTKNKNKNEYDEIDKMAYVKWFFFISRKY
jgi:hypothetical protein